MTKTSKKNQHYVPQFYLRNFSFKNNQTQIGIYNINNSFFYQSAPLKNQASKNFFYGYDGVVEDYLCDLEGKLSTEIREIVTTQNVPQRGSIGHSELIYFIILTHLRNPVNLERIENIRETMLKFTTEFDKSRDYDKLIPKITRSKAIAIALSRLETSSKVIRDLEFKLLINKSNTPFISSDLPVVRYNKFLEKEKWSHGRIGLGNVGLQIFIPITPRITLFFFDSNIYKTGFKRRKTHDISKETDIDQLNLLQILNCYNTVFFNEEITEQYIRSLHEKSKKFTRANIDTSKFAYLLKEGENSSSIIKEEPNLIVSSYTSCAINLDIEGIRIHSGSQSILLDNHSPQIRPRAKLVMDENKTAPAVFRIPDDKES